jgi:probable HAF family extracellular repeat protein
MKSRILICITAMTVFAALATPIRLAAQDHQEHHTKQPRYSVRDLGSLGGTSCCLVVTINNRGWVDGTSNLEGDRSFHPFLWIDGQMIDLGTLGGPNASVGGMNEVGDVTVGGSDTGMPDPLGEDFCGFGTHQTCRSFVWYRGHRTLIPTLGGNNNDVSTIDNKGKCSRSQRQPFTTQRALLLKFSVLRLSLGCLRVARSMYFHRYPAILFRSASE